jgi:hypothetical protein
MQLWTSSIEGQFRFDRLQMANFLSFLRKQTDKLLFAQWTNGKRIKESRLFPFSLFRLMSQCLHVSRICKREAELKKNGNIRFFLKRERETANFRLSAVNRNGKQMLVYLGR